MILENIKLFIQLFTKQKQIVDREQFLQNFFSLPFHQWIVDDPHLKRIFQILLEMLDDRAINYFQQQRPVAFFYSAGKYSCCLGAIGNFNSIIVFPDLIKILKSASLEHGLAILAHEIGHLLYDHSNLQIHPLQAQFQADDFVCQLGLGKHLKDILLDHENLEECKLRLQYLQRRLDTPASN